MKIINNIVTLKNLSAEKLLLTQGTDLLMIYIWIYMTVWICDTSVNNFLIWICNVKNSWQLLLNHKDSDDYAGVFNFLQYDPDLNKIFPYSYYIYEQ